MFNSSSPVNSVVSQDKSKRKSVDTENVTVMETKLKILEILQVSMLCCSDINWHLAAGLWGVRYILNTNKRKYSDSVYMNIKVKFWQLTGKR